MCITRLPLTVWVTYSLQYRSNSADGVRPRLIVTHLFVSGSSTFLHAPLSGSTNLRHRYKADTRKSLSVHLGTREVTKVHDSILALFATVPPYVYAFQGSERPNIPLGRRWDICRLISGREPSVGAGEPILLTR